ncbi:hypothetical protein [Streptomyces albogriseolus]|uniref:hypothetical protein n=1 Tax=Streptomyces albogriseolus TaxID=1887 RepID=UPI0033A79A78
MAQTVPRSWTMAQALASFGVPTAGMYVWAWRPYCRRYSSEELPRWVTVTRSRRRTSLLILAHTAQRRQPH